ncbi:acyltransferase [Ancylostoma ceylanicum]|uniref:Acyltransferase n=1 Tax=Ancylostoma ceylanicum TaxID=53326 RepID=A0A0D6LZN4_9BILA|nr:acyltransferase [Ancylostoma ceylanicum]
MSEKRLDIQGLRGWAIVLVLLFHFFPDYFPNGYIGVDMFFVISGFLIAMILRRSDSLDMEAFRSFYYRRIKRILPLYYLAIACILIALFLLLPSSYRSMNIDSSRRAIILISNIKKVEDMDAKYQKMLQNAEDLFTHTWSLCVEMQWYLLVPLIFVAQRFATAWEKTFFTGELGNFPGILAMLEEFYLGVAISSIVFYLLVDDMNSFYCVLARIWQFCCGVLALLMQNEEPAKELPQPEKIALLDSETCDDEALILGLVSSILVAVAAYHLFEKYYLTWPPQGVLSMLAVLVAVCAILALQPHSVDEQMSFMAKSPFDTMKPIEEDKIFQDHMWRMGVLEKIAKKVYLLQALPSCIKSCSVEAQKFMNTGRPLRDIQEGLIKRDDFFARQRIQEVGKRCRACEIIDYLPALVNENGHYLGYNPRTNLMYLDDHNHFTRFGKNRLQALFNQLARNFSIPK